MNIVNVVQGSAEWHALRTKSFGASDAPAMLGISPHKTRTELLREKATGIAREFSDYEQDVILNGGKDIEAAARPIVEAWLATELFPITATLEVDGITLSASFDGVSMDEEIVWENKRANAENVAGVAAAIETQHWPQLEQQALVAGVSRIYFTVSDGAEEGTKGHWYASRAERRAQVIAGWKQFKEDLAKYQHIEDAPKLVGRAPETLPTLHIEVAGNVLASNLVAFRETALTVIGAINTNLQTDEDFANAEKTVKWCGDVEDRLDAAKRHALAQTQSIESLFRAIDDIKEEARTKRLNLEKLVKARKEQIRREIVDGAGEALRAHVASLNAILGKPYLPEQDVTRFGLAVKGLKTVTSLRDAVGTELANAKIAASAIADRIQTNLNTLRELALDHAFLFHDTATIVLKQPDDLRALVKTRIADHKAAEEKRISEERERIRKEELAKIATAAPTAPAPLALNPGAPPSVAAAPLDTSQIVDSRLPAAFDIPQPKFDPTRDDKLVERYLATLREPPKKKAEIKKHINAFIAFATQESVREIVNKSGARVAGCPTTEVSRAHD